MKVGSKNKTKPRKKKTKKKINRQAKKEQTTKGKKII